MTKTKRKPMQLSDEERARRSERMKATMAARKPIETGAALKSIVEEVQPTRREMSSEAQAVVDSMDPARRVKLEMIQARNLATLAQTKEGREAIERLEARHVNVEKIAAAKPGAVIPVPDLEPQTRADVRAVIEATQPPKLIVREVPMKAPFRLTGSQSGQMISELGNCLCGEPKLRWHPICLKVRV
jgi:hypothetical protein